MFTTPDLGRIAVVHNSSLSSSEPRRARGREGARLSRSGRRPRRVGSHTTGENRSVAGPRAGRVTSQPSCRAPLHPRALLASGLAQQQHREWAVLPRGPWPSGVGKEDHQQQCRPPLKWEGEGTAGMPLWPESIRPSPQGFFFFSLFAFEFTFGHCHQSPKCLPLTFVQHTRRLISQWMKTSRVCRPARGWSRRPGRSGRARLNSSHTLASRMPSSA